MRADLWRAAAIVLGSLVLMGMGASPESPEAGPDAGPPSKEFLEFLATFDSGDGRFVDPASLEYLQPSATGGDAHD